MEVFSFCGAGRLKSFTLFFVSRFSGPFVYLLQGSTQRLKNPYEENDKAGKNKQRTMKPTRISASSTQRLPRLWPAEPGFCWGIEISRCVCSCPQNTRPLHALKCVCLRYVFHLTGPGPCYFLLLFLLLSSHYKDRSDLSTRYLYLSVLIQRMTPSIAWSQVTF